MENSAPWRQAPATKPQIESLRQKMAGLGSEQELENFLTRITKGEVSLNRNNCGLKDQTVHPE